MGAADAVAPKLRCAVASRPCPGEVVSGDRHVIVSTDGGTLVAAIDGLGHGAAAAAAADRAVEIIESRAGPDLVEAIHECHAGLRDTRGAVMTLAFVPHSHQELTWIAVGNVEGVVWPPSVSPGPSRGPGPTVDGRQHVVMRGGVVGAGSLPKLTSSSVPFVDGATLILATDGITSRFFSGTDLSGEPQGIADDVLERHARGNDDALVLVIRRQGGG